MKTTIAARTTWIPKRTITLTDGGETIAIVAGDGDANAMGDAALEERGYVRTSFWRPVYTEEGLQAMEADAVRAPSAR
jgi:hypothetical protein